MKTRLFYCCSSRAQPQLADLPLGRWSRVNVRRRLPERKLPLSDSSMRRCLTPARSALPAGEKSKEPQSTWLKWLVKCVCYASAPSAGFVFLTAHSMGAQRARTLDGVALGGKKKKGRPGWRNSPACTPQAQGLLSGHRRTSDGPPRTPRSPRPDNASSAYAGLHQNTRHCAWCFVLFVFCHAARYRPTDPCPRHEGALSGHAVFLQCPSLPEPLVSSRVSDPNTLAILNCVNPPSCDLTRSRIHRLFFSTGALPL